MRAFLQHLDGEALQLCELREGDRELFLYCRIRTISPCLTTFLTFTTLFCVYSEWRLLYDYLSVNLL